MLLIVSLLLSLSGRPAYNVLQYTKQQEKDINGLKQKLAEVQTEHKHVINQLQMCEERHKKVRGYQLCNIT